VTARTALLLALLCVLGACTDASRPNIILITIDTLRADHVGAYGYADAATPTLDLLAAQGRMFLQATTPFPRTTPAIASLFTGLQPWRHGSREIWQPFTHGTTLAQLLRAEGYATVGVSGNPAAGGRQNLDRGFDYFVEADALPDDSAESVVDATLDLLQTVETEHGLFLWVHLMDPHFPYRPPETLQAQPAAPECRRLMEEIGAGRLRMGHVEGDALGASTRALHDCTQLYDAEISNADLHVGRLLDTMAAAGQTEGAYILLTADHGENLGEDDFFYGHGPSLHDASVRVPLIVTGPGIEGGVDPLPVRLEDIAPTLLGLLGLPVAADLDGLDLAARFRGQAPRQAPPVARIEGGSALNVSYTKRIFSGRAHSRTCIHDERFSLCGFPGRDVHLFDHEADPFLETDVSGRYPEARLRLLESSRKWRPEQVRERALRDGRYKLVERPVLQGGFVRQLFDLREDPAERVDVTDRFPLAAQRLATGLDNWSTSLPLQVPAPAPEDVKSLQSLGYVE
jgi:arylsulfatase A-like enzyme